MSGLPAPSSPSPYRFAAVSHVARVTPNMQRITLYGGDLTGFVSSGDPDERLLVVFPDEGADWPPQPIGDTWDYPADGPRPEMRRYTVRRWDCETCEMDIDFAVHDGGAAARWARPTRPGQVLGVTTASGWYLPPVGTAWRLLVADMTAAPTGGAGYIWFAGEAGCSREVRRWVRHELGLLTEHVIGYWRADKEAWTAHYGQVRDRIKAARTAALAAGGDFDAVRAAVDTAMEDAGLLGPRYS